MTIFTLAVIALLLRLVFSLFRFFYPREEAFGVRRRHIQNIQNLHRREEEENDWPFTQYALSVVFILYIAWVCDLLLSPRSAEAASKEIVDRYRWDNSVYDYAMWHKVFGHNFSMFFAFEQNLEHIVFNELLPKKPNNPPETGTGGAKNESSSEVNGAGSAKNESSSEVNGTGGANDESSSEVNGTGGAKNESSSEVNGTGGAKNESSSDSSADNCYYALRHRGTPSVDMFRKMQEWGTSDVWEGLEPDESDCHAFDGCQTYSCIDENGDQIFAVNSCVPDSGKCCANDGGTPKCKLCHEMPNNPPETGTGVAKNESSSEENGVTTGANDEMSSTPAD